MIRAEGVNGQVELDGNVLRIQRKGVRAFLTQGLKGDKEILVKSITSIQVKPAGMIANGYIQFGFFGGKESKGGIFDATKDENTVMFNKKQAQDFARLKASVDEARLAELPAAGPGQSDADELEKLAGLRDRGILTPEEFEAKKRQILGL